MTYQNKDDPESTQQEISYFENFGHCFYLSPAASCPLRRPTNMHRPDEQT